MANLQIPTYIIAWTTHYLRNRSTYFNLNGYKGPVYYLQKGLPQGSPISPILFLIFSIDLHEALNSITHTSGYADDIFTYVASDSVEKNLQQLTKVISLATDWARTNDQSFSIHKTELIHFTRRHINNLPGINNPITFQDTLIHPCTSIRLLGVYFDSKLNWKVHVRKKLNLIQQKWSRYTYVFRKIYNLTYNIRRTLDIAPSNFQPIKRCTEYIFRTICGAIKHSNH